MKRVALAMTVAALTVPACASAATWRAPQLLSADGDGSAGSPTTPTLAVDGDGTAIAGWTPIVGGTVKLRRAASTTGAAPWVAQKGSVSAGREGATAATNSERLEAWVDITDVYSDETGVVVRVRERSGAAEETRQLAIQPRGATLLRAAAAPEPNGPFAVAWVEKAKAVDAVVLWVRSARRAWSRVEVPAPSGGFAHVTGLALALGGEGTVSIAALGNDRVVHAIQRARDGSWSPWRALSTAVASGPQVAYTTPGGFVYAWTRLVNSTTLAVEAAAAPSTDAAPGPLKVLDPGAARGPVRLAFSSVAVGVTAVWPADGPTARGGRVVFANRHPSGRWSSASPIASDGDERLSDPWLAGIRVGKLVAVWRRGGGATGFVEGSVRPLKGRWSAPQRLSAPGSGAIGSLALAAGGRYAHVLWDSFTARGGTWRVFASRVRP
jgi:hypothetical protein